MIRKPTAAIELVTVRVVWLEMELYLISRSKDESQFSRLFCTRDLTGTEYVGVVLPSSNQLWMIRDEFLKSTSLELGVKEIISGSSVASLPQLGVMLVLDHRLGLALYSGLHKVREFQNRSLHGCLKVPEIFGTMFCARLTAVMIAGV